jgi:hypothetical protein
VRVFHASHIAAIDVQTWDGPIDSQVSHTVTIDLVSLRAPDNRRPPQNGQDFSLGMSFMEEALYTGQALRCIARHVI